METITMDKILQARLRAWTAEPTDEHAQAVTACVARAELGSETTKVVISRGYGGGFGSSLGYASPTLGKFCVEYPALVIAVELGDPDTIRSALDALRADVMRDFGSGSIEVDTYPLESVDLESLTVVEVDGPYRIREYDGAESVESLSSALERFW
jgi:hypothetical protein